MCPTRNKPKCWDIKVYSRGNVYSQGSQARRCKGKSQLHLLEGEGLEIFMGYRIKVLLGMGTSGSVVKRPTCQYRRCGFDPWVGKRKWPPSPIFLTGKSHGQRSLEGYHPWGFKRVGHDWATKQQHRWLEVGRGEAVSVLWRCIWVTHFFMGCTLKNGSA